VQATPEALERTLREAEEAVARAGSVQELTEIRAGFLGRKGSLTAVLRGLGALPPDARARLGEAANRAKQRIEASVESRREVLERASREEALREGALDVTLPGFAPPVGHLHPVTRIERDMVGFFRGLGYGVEDGPEVESDRNNFSLLNFPDDHPARDMQDTFFVEGGHVLRTHTSNVQIRAMTGREPPFRFIAPGRVYRHDLDATHFPMFHQIEAFCVDEDVTFADLRGTLYAFARHLFGSDVKLRFRASFFPFTEPSAELDFWWEDRWLEWGGCGMIHPNVLRNCGIDPERWQGFAFGMGIDRTAMDRHGIPNIQLLFEGDVRVMELDP
jgi:phenylalanyl-tRNA synthetase alpha chain